LYFLFKLFVVPVNIINGHTYWYSYSNKLPNNYIYLCNVAACN